MSANTTGLVVDLLCFCVVSHSYRMNVTPDHAASTGSRGVCSGAAADPVVHELAGVALAKAGGGRGNPNRGPPRPLGNIIKLLAPGNRRDPRTGTGVMRAWLEESATHILGDQVLTRAHPSEPPNKLCTPSPSKIGLTAASRRLKTPDSARSLAPALSVRSLSHAPARPSPALSSRSSRSITTHHHPHDTGSPFTPHAPKSGHSDCASRALQRQRRAHTAAVRRLHAVRRGCGRRRGSGGRTGEARGVAALPDLRPAFTTPETPPDMLSRAHDPRRPPPCPPSHAARSSDRPAHLVPRRPCPLAKPRGWRRQQAPSRQPPPRPSAPQPCRPRRRSAPACRRSRPPQAPRPAASARRSRASRRA